MIKLKSLLLENVDGVWFHGSPSGDLRGGTSGLHLGTLKAAQEALHARIGYPVDGDWDGTRKYGETLLCGKNTLKQRNIFPTGFNVDVPNDDFIPDTSPPSAEYLSLSMKPAIKKYKILCQTVNSIYTPYSDINANARMKGLIRRRQGRRGIFYKNDGEDAGSISIVVPNGSCVEEL